MKKALFLDRDGVINVNHGYVYKIEDMDFVPGIFELVQDAKQKGYLVVVVTNQSGIARGMYTKAQADTLHEWMQAQFVQHGGAIDAVYLCPHHPTQGNSEYTQVCQCRKPSNGMLVQADQDWQIDFAHSVLVGDKLSDIKAACASDIGLAFWFDGTVTDQDTGSAQSEAEEPCNAADVDMPYPESKQTKTQDILTHNKDSHKTKVLKITSLSEISLR